MVQCRITPKVFPEQTLRNMRHERISHMLKGVIAKYDGCNKSFTSKELFWNAVKNWVGKLNQQPVPIFPNLEKGYLLSKYQMESLALRFGYDMEFYNRQPCEEMEQVLKTIVLLHLTNMTIVTEKAVSKSQMNADFLFHETFSQIMKLLSIGVQSHLNGFQLLVRGRFHYVSHLQLNLRDMFQIYS
jgi:hypothetical protein